MAALAKVADEQVGRVVQRLKDDGVLDETLIVLTTDHAQQTSKHFYGVDGAGRGNFNWYYGADADETYLDPQPEIQRLIDETGNVEMSMQDSAIRTWLVDRSLAAKREAAGVMATLGGVRATYSATGDHYELVWSAPRSRWTNVRVGWWRKHGQEIVNTAAADYGPDVIGLLRDNASYGVAGDHGGAQEAVQRIPIVFSGPGSVPGRSRATAIRSVDILPTVLRALGIPRDLLDRRAGLPAALIDDCRHREGRGSAPALLVASEWQQVATACHVIADTLNVVAHAVLGCREEARLEAMSDPTTVTRTPRKAALAAWTGSALEYYDLAIYGTAAALVFPDIFFPEGNDSAATVAAFATFGVAYVARPIGSFLMGHIGDRLGRKKVLIGTLLLMGVSTFLVGCLPTYQQVGMLAPVLLVILRLLQGLSAAGEQAGANSMSFEHAPDDRRGFFTSFTLSGTQGGQVLAPAVFLPLAAVLPEEQLQSWGWRVPFWISALVVIVGFVIRRRLDETPAFQAEADSDEVPRAPLGVLFGDHWRGVLRVFFAAFIAMVNTMFADLRAQLRHVRRLRDRLQRHVHAVAGDRRQPRGHRGHPVLGAALGPGRPQAGLRHRRRRQRRPDLGVPRRDRRRQPGR